MCVCVCTFSMLHLSGMTSIQRYPFTAAAMARAVPVQREGGDTEHIHSGTSVHHHPIHSSHPSPPHKHTHSQAHRKKGRRYRTQAQKVSNWVCEPDYKGLGVTSSSGQRRGQNSQSEPGSTSTITSELKSFSTLLPLGIQPHVCNYLTTLTSVSRGWLYDGATRFQKAVSLCLLNHPHCNTILDGPTSIEVLTFCHCVCNMKGPINMNISHKTLLKCK